MKWIVTIVAVVVLVAAYAWMFLYARKRQKKFDAQYNAAKERYEVFVLHKKMTRERPASGWQRFIKLKTYQVTGRITVSQAIRGMQMSKTQNLTFQTTKSEYDKVLPNHKYKMDIAGNYIGLVLAPAAAKTKGNSVSQKGFRRFIPNFGMTKGSKGHKNTEQSKTKSKSK